MPMLKSMAPAGMEGFHGVYCTEGLAQDQHVMVVTTLSPPLTCLGNQYLPCLVRQLSSVRLAYLLHFLVSTCVPPLLHATCVILPDRLVEFRRIPT